MAFQDRVVENQVDVKMIAVERNALLTSHEGEPLAKFEEAVYVLHCFQKKTQATSRQDKKIDPVSFPLIT